MRLFIVTSLLFTIAAPVFAETPQTFIKAKASFTDENKFDLWVYDRGWQVGWGWVTVYSWDRKLKYRFWKTPTPEQVEEYGQPVIEPDIKFAFTPEAIAATGGAQPLPATKVEYDSYTEYENKQIKRDEVRILPLKGTSNPVSNQ